MSITTHAELKTALAAWTAFSAATSGQLDDFITLAEAKINRRLRVPEMETAMAETAIASDAIARPTGLLEFKAIWCTGGQQRSLEPKTLEFIIRQPAVAALPQWYAWDGANLRFFPSSGSVSGVYYARIPALSAGANWLIAAAPDLYLSGALEQAFKWLKDEASEERWRAETDGLISEMNSRAIANQFAGAKLVARRA